MRIKSGIYLHQIVHLRQLLTTQGKGPYDQAQRSLAVFTPAGVFTRRANARLTEASGLVHFDFDHPPNLAQAKVRFTEDPWIVYAFVSPSGDGLKVAVWADGIVDDRTYKHAWGTVLAYFERTYPDLAVANDKACKEIARLCFVSHDPALYSNPDARLYVVPPYQEPARSPNRLAQPARPIPSRWPLVRASRPAWKMPCRRIPADDYDTWLRVGMALHASGEAWARAVWDTWSQRSDKYDPPMQQQKWGSFTADGGVNLATLFHLAKQYGYTPPREAPLRAGKQARPAIPDMTGAASGQQDAPTTARDPDALPYSDYTNALAFVRDHGANAALLLSLGQVAGVDRHPLADRRYRPRHALGKGDGETPRAACGGPRRPERHRCVTAARQSLALNGQAQGPSRERTIRAAPTCLPEDLDRDPWLLNASNGTIDLRTGTLQPHRREDLLTRCIPVAYDPDAACPTWDSFLARIMAGNANLISFLQRAVGYALTGVIREHVLLILWGSGRNGKSTFLNTLRTLLGPYAMKAPSELLMVSNNDRHPTERADLLGKRFVAAIETEQGRRLAEVFVKEATGGDPIRARRMREDFWEFQPTHKVFLATNHKPVITGRTMPSGNACGSSLSP